MRILHRPSGLILAEGRRGWPITPFEGNFYVRRDCLRGGRWRTRPLPGLCVYKFIYLWLDLDLEDGACSPRLGWRYVVPNPLLPFIAFRVAMPGTHPEIRIED